MPDHPPPSGEFYCSECGRHFVHVVGPVNEFRLCRNCIWFPGWYDIPEVRAILDPDGPDGPERGGDG